MIGKGFPRDHALLVVLLLAAGGARADDAEVHRNVVVFLEDPGKFEVLYSRAESSATGAVLFGLIGYGVEESTRNSNDTKREEAIEPALGDITCDQFVVDALTSRLEEKGYAVEVREEKAPRSASDGYVIRVDIVACGFRMINTTSDEVSSFFAANYEVLKPGQVRSKKMEEMIVTGSEKASWETYLNNRDMADSEFDAALIKGGRRIANKLIYSK